MAFAGVRLAIALGVCLGCGSVAARAQVPALQVSPVLVQLRPGEMTTTLNVVNVGATTTTVQLRPFAWEQSGGADVLTPTDELAVSPPITDIEGGQSQVFRLVLRKPPGSGEASYRVLLDQLPPPAQPGSIRFALRLSIPVFAGASDDKAAHIAWKLRRDGGRTMLVGRNDGDQHVRVLAPVLRGAAQSPVATEQQHGPYILPGASQSWLVRNPGRLSPGATMNLTAQSSAGPLNTTVNVVAP